MTKLINIFYFILIAISVPTLAVDRPPKDIITFDAQLEKVKVESNQILLLKVYLDVIDGHYLYKDKTKVIWPKDFKIKQSKLEITPVETIFDKFSKKEKLVIRNKATLTATVELPSFKSNGAKQIPIGIKYQACSKSYCLLPKKKFENLEFEVINNSGDTNPNSDKSYAENKAFSFENALQKGWFFTFLFVFFAGILTSFTPCVFPMVPITLAVIGSQGKDSTKLKGFTLSLFYVLGIAFTYSSLGIFAAKTGALFGSFMSSPIVVGSIAAILILMALSMFGLFEIKTPAFLTNKVMKSGKTSGFRGAFVAGLVAGIVASPCIGPVLVGILAFVAKSQNMFLGFWLLFAFALGLGVLFIVLGTFSHLIQYLPKSGHWMNVTKNIFGISMLALAIYFASPLMPRSVVLLIIGITSIALGITLGFLRSGPAPQKFPKELLGSISILVGVLLIFQAGSQFQLSDKTVSLKNHSDVWADYSEEKVNSYLALGKPVIIDFQADWCAACKELEAITFQADEFNTLSKQFGLLKVDATEVTPEVTEVTEKFGVLGLPTIIFIDVTGKIRTELTLTGFENIEGFSKRMKAVIPKKQKTE